MMDCPVFEIATPDGALVYSCPVCNQTWMDPEPCMHTTKQVMKDLRKHSHPKGEWASAWSYGNRKPFICP